MIILDEKGWMCMKKPERIFVIGHKNPDTDSICSAIAYADIKNRTTQNKKYIPKRAGQINEETRYVLNRFQKYEASHFWTSDSLPFPLFPVRSVSL